MNETLQQYKNWLIAERGNKKSTVKLMMYYTQRFFDWLNNEGISIDDVDQSVVNQYICNEGEHYSQNAMVPITANLRKLLMHFLEKDVTVKMASSVAPKRDKTALTEDEIKNLFSAADDDPLASAVLQTLYYGCLRNQELRNLDICDVDFDALRITVRYPKGNEYRTVNITRNCANAIKRYLQHRPKPKEGHENALFVTRSRMRISKTWIIKLAKKYAADANIEKKMYPHKLRISSITHMAEHGYGIKDIQPQSGHNDEKILLGYIQSVSSRQRQVYDDVFSDDIVDDRSTIAKPQHPDIPDEDYEKIIVKKFLDGDIDRQTMNSMLKTFETSENNSHGDENIAYG